MFNFKRWLRLMCSNLLIREETNVVMVGILQGKTAMDTFQWLIAVKRGHTFWIRSTDSQEYDG